MSDGEATIDGQDSGLSGDVAALPQLDRPPIGIDGHDRAGLAAGGAESLDGPAARQKSLELVRAAVELADRVESQARDAAAERLRRADEELGRRRAEIEAREHEFERVRQDIERQHQQAAEAMRATQGLVESAQQEAARTLDQARAEVAALLDQARADAQRVLDEARAEADGLRTRANAEAEELRQSERAKIEQAVNEAVQQAKEGQGAQGAPPPSSNGSAPADESQLPFAPPPLSPEDLATGTLPRFGGTLHRSAAQR